VLNDESSDTITKFIMQKGHIYTDKQLAEIISKKFNKNISPDRICKIRYKLGIHKWPVFLRPVSNISSNNNISNNNINKEVLRKVSEAILHFADGTNTIYIHASRLRPLGVKQGEASYAFGVLRKKGVAKKVGKSGSGGITWKINVEKLKRIEKWY